jgi:hypothetical protein
MTTSTTKKKVHPSPTIDTKSRAFRGEKVFDKSSPLIELGKDREGSTSNILHNDIKPSF